MESKFKESLPSLRTAIDIFKKALFRGEEFSDEIELAMRSVVLNLPKMALYEAIKVNDVEYEDNVGDNINPKSKNHIVVDGHKKHYTTKDGKKYVAIRKYEPIQKVEDDINANVPDRANFIGYKQFKTKYNPLDKSTYWAKGLLFPLYVGKDDPTGGIEVGSWYKCGIGELRVQVDDKGNPIDGPLQVGSDLGNLSYRPGWHLGSAPSTRHIGKDPVSKGANNYNAMYSENVWCKVEYSAHYDFTDKAKKQPGANKNPKKACFTDKKEFEKGFYTYQTNANADNSETWLIADAIRILDVISDEDVAKICKDKGLEPQYRYPATKGVANCKFMADFSQFKKDTDKPSTVGTLR